MSLTVNHPTLKEQMLTVQTTSIGGTPLAAYLRVPFRGKIIQMGLVAQGVITTADCSTALSNVTQSVTITGSPLILPVASAAAGQLATMNPTGNNDVVEDDIIKFLPSGASGSSIGGLYFAVIRVA